MKSTLTQPVIQLPSQGPAAGEVLAVAGSLVTALGDAAVLVDDQMRSLCFSPQFANLVGMRGRALARDLERGVPFLELFQHIDLEQRTLDDCLHRATRVCLYDVAGTNAQGENFIVIVSLLPVINTSGQALGIACILREVTAEVALQRSFREMLIAEQKKSGELEALVNERTKELRLALDEVTAHASALAESRQREVAVQKSVFAGRLATGLAHEFNSPLACVLSNQSYLKSRLEEAIAASGTASPEVVGLWTEAIEILGEDTGSLHRLSATISSLQGFCSSSDPEADDHGPPATRIEDIIRDVRIALGPDVTREQVEFIDIHEGTTVDAYRADVGMAVVSLVQFLLDYEAPESVKDLGDWQAKGHAAQTSTPAARCVTLRCIEEESHYVLSLACDQLAIDIDDAESAFDPSLVVAAGNRVKLSVDLSVSAARIARSGGNLQFGKAPSGGTRLEVRLLMHR